YQPERSPIREHLQVPVRDRLWWGGYKNLISGATTVVHHDPFTRRMFHRRFPVRVLRRYGWSHSLGYGDLEDLPRAYAESRGRPFIVHAAEGVDEASLGEIDRLDELGLLGSNTVLVHAVALTAAQQRRIADAGASVVWCPASNLRLYGRTAAVDELRGRVEVGLGTDSTLSGSPTLLDEMRAGLATGLATADEIVAMVTEVAARIFGLADRGRIGEGLAADLIVIPDTGGRPAETLLAATAANLALVVVGGDVRLASPEWAEALDLGTPNAVVDGCERWLVGDVGALRRKILRAAVPWAPHDNPLWSLIR
ncbi:MAG: amidohydrolase family protein, partial [Thermoanaerobaculia bacterium]